MSSQPYAQTERSSGVYTATLLDEDGVAVTSLDSLVVWLRDVGSGTILNGRNGTSILNTGGGTFAAGQLIWEMSAADHAMVGARVIEIHEAEFSAVWDTTKRKTWTAQWKVRNLTSVTA